MKVFIPYWRWLFKGSGSGPGIKRFFDRWLFIHLGIGAGLAWLVPLSLTECANTVLLPLAGIIIGLAFAWAGNAQGLLQTSEMEELSIHHSGGFVEYVYVYQTAILLILIVLVSWCLAGFSIFDKRWPWQESVVVYFTIKAFLFAISSASLRECWHIILSAQWMLLSQREIRIARKQTKKDQRS